MQAIKPPNVPNAKAIKAKFGGVSLTFLGDGPVGKSHTRDQQLVAKFSKDTGIKVKLVPHPVASDASYAQLARTFSANSSAFDVVMLDVLWTGAFGPYLYNMKRILAKDAAKHSKGIILNNTVGGKLVAMPWFGDFGILYYRQDLLTKYGYSAPPKTWAQLGAMAQKIQDGERAANPNFYGFVYQGNAYEGLTCDALEWLASSGGGRIIDGGRVTINNPRAVAILNLQRSWVGKITPRGVTTYQEGESEKAFTAGNAAFMRNWPYAYAIGQDGPIKGKFNVTTLPKTGANAPVGTVGRLATRGVELLEEASGRRRARPVPDRPGGRAVQRHLQQQRPDDPERGCTRGRPEGEPLAEAGDRQRGARHAPVALPRREVRAGLADHLPGHQPDPERTGREERAARGGSTTRAHPPRIGSRGRAERRHDDRKRMGAGAPPSSL